ncbi:MAG TPA: acetoacetate decarboxylase family protein [Acidimicrobiia bacterium]
MTAVATVMGEPITFPVEVRDARSWFASFLVPFDAMSRLVGPTGLEPATGLGGRAMLSLAFVRYIDSDLGPYHEVAVAPLVRAPGSDTPKPAGAYIRQLPVNQAFTCEAGRALWGFPKFMAEISITEGRRGDECVLEHEGAHVMTLTVAHGCPAPMRDTALDAYSWLDGRLRRTKWSLGGRWSRMRPGGVTMALGSHPIADELRALELPRRALLSGCVSSVTMSFDAAEDVEAGAVA